MPRESQGMARAGGERSVNGPQLGLIDGLVQSSFAVQAAMRRVARRHDLSIVQARLLGILRDREPGILLLAGYLHLDKSSVTGLVDRAERRHLVERSARPEDRRGVRVALTLAGRSLAAQFTEEVGEELLGLTAGLTAAERRQLASLLSRVVSAGQGSAAAGDGQ